MSQKTNSVSVRQMIQSNKKNKGSLRIIESVMPKLFLTCALISILTTFGILFTLIFETITFFKEVSIIEFITGTQWFPFSHSSPSYGILPLISGTLLITVIAMLVAIPVGLAAAIYLSEFATDRVRRIIKPILEVLAGIPTIVYGFFALGFVTPLLKNFIPDLSIYNALSAGIVVGIMIIPMVASLSEDAMSSVPNAMREGALGLGSTRLEVSLKVVLPAALSGVIASFVLAISRAIGETMIVALAAGSNPIATIDVTQSIQTMTAYMVQVFGGDVGYGTTLYYSVYAVGMTLFLFTFVMNLLAQYISRRFREEY
ncbi:phosphate ABC transporter permease subunit PstC [Lottiidibacillus patelloidae]|uniref:Phosphate transport system permease protein n=1 Tax=Lottiidibacillus patelloidae TaxID=2670334 RepID=A0A263BVB3_9BACI|nr:phosphate ABC transporter permease subunit PstC [Lottiidibacillus patelloidae]OZM57693.1 phosphate ABC transporter permease subunit PstC [Lottiidibacillus patelloidae]